MTDEKREEGRDRIIVRLDPGGPVEITDLTGSFAALARMYERHYRKEGDAPAPKLYVTRLESGSVVAEIVPYALLLGALVTVMDGSVVVADFTRRTSAGLRAFINPVITDTQATLVPVEPAPSKEDAEDLRHFVKPLTGRKGASLGISHARYEKRHEDGSHTIAEYKFDETELNRAAINIDKALEAVSKRVE
jgi:hypothetical protein